MGKQWRQAFVTHFFTCILAANWPLFLILPLPTFKAADKSLPLWGGEAQYRNSLREGLHFATTQSVLQARSL